ncbi:MAG: site-2 protease family protein [Firmicutes bacterium]|nr:site-2 protease family protein [Bacillota bacterium]
MRKKLYDNHMLLLLVVFLAAERIMDMAVSDGSIGASAIHWIIETLLALPAILIGLSFHEFAHAKASQLCGDPTPEYYGRVSLSPQAHMDPMGFVSLLFLGFGWGIPVPVNSRYYKNRRAGEIIVGLAGVVTNFAIAVAVGLIIKVIVMISPEFAVSGFGSILLYILMRICWTNLLLMGFNLIPCPPLDGFNVLANVLGFRDKEIYYQIYDKGMILLILLVVFNLPGKIMMEPLVYLADFIYGTLMNLPWAYFLLVSPI